MFLKLSSLSGADPEISERGGWKPNSRKGGPEFDFSVPLSVIFLLISYHIPPKGGAAARPAPPLNLHLIVTYM